MSFDVFESSLIFSRDSPPHHSDQNMLASFHATLFVQLARAFLLFSLHTTKAEMMNAFTTGTALAFGRAMSICLGLTSPLNETM